MKKLLPAIGLIVLVLGGVIVFRAETVFPDRQVPPAELAEIAPFDEAAAIERFAGSIPMRTISNDDRSDFDAAAFDSLNAYLEATFPRVHAAANRTVINGYSLLYELPGSRPDLDPVLFAGHTDVVPVDASTLDQWTHPPFAGTVADERVWGRGTIDDKLTVLALLEALESLLADGFAPERTIMFGFGHDEEVGGRDGAAQIVAHLAERGVELEFMVDEGGLVTVGMYPGVMRPVAIIGVSEKGYVNSRLIVEEAGGHSSQPPAQTGLAILARAILRVEESPFPATLEHLAGTFSFLGDEVPFRLRALFANRWLLDPLLKRGLSADKGASASMRTTIAPTMASGSSKSNVLPTRAEAVINHRIMPGETVESVRQHVVAAIDDDRVQVVMEMGTEPSPVSPAEGFGYELIASTIRGVDPDILVAPYLVQGGTDAKYYYALTPNVYRFMMIHGDAATLRRIHGIDEHITIADYLRAVRFYQHLIARSAEPAA